jgi:hypothetical protein
MSLTPEIQLAIVRHLAEKAARVAECGYILPAPIYFNDKQDFQAQISGLALTTQKSIETAQVALTVISYLRFEDLPDGEEQGTEVELHYKFTVFRQSNFERADETLTPDAFLKKMLKSYSDFTAAIVNLREEFRGVQLIPSLTGDEFSEAETTSLAQDDFARENAACPYIPNVRGFLAELVGKVTLIYAEC